MPQTRYHQGTQTGTNIFRPLGLSREDNPRKSASPAEQARIPQT